MQQIETAFRDAGVVVPSTSNEKGMRSQSWSTDYQNVGGAVDVYGLDSYPGGLSCTNANAGFKVPRNYFQWFANYSFTQPSFLPEFEAGWFSGWGSSFYDQVGGQVYRAGSMSALTIGLCSVRLSTAPASQTCITRTTSARESRCRVSTWLSEAPTGAIVRNPPVQCYAPIQR